MEMKKKIPKFLCYWFGHKFHTLFHKTLHERSIIGTIKCSRCGYQEDFQYDR
jgi:transcription elongation factor Elf1